LRRSSGLFFSWGPRPRRSRAIGPATSFGFVNRYRWTNDNGQVFTPGTTFRLSDFDGKIVFFVFFDVW
jgi:hypothetical protein